MLGQLPSLLANSTPTKGSQSLAPAALYLAQFVTLYSAKLNLTTIADCFVFLVLFHLYRKREALPLSPSCHRPSVLWRCES